MYKVIVPFADSQDDGHVYFTGSTYPREGIEPTAERIIELASTANGRGYPLIEEVEEEIPFCDDTPVTEEMAEEIPAEETPAEPVPERKPKTTKPKAPAKPKTGSGRNKTKK